MLTNIRIWVMGRYHKIVNSIAFYPAIIALLFLFLSILSLLFDFSDYGKSIKANSSLLQLHDASTARSIITSIVAGIISLTVFSFSMVMIVLNQTASHMSNRSLDKLIGSRFQQLVLGAYVGTIVYALFLLSTIRDIESGIQVPALSTYLLILLTIFDIFLFIYFLHYITQSVKHEVIIQRIFKDTKEALERSCRLKVKPTEEADNIDGYIIHAPSSGIFEGFDKRSLLNICTDKKCSIRFLHAPGTFVLEGFPLIKCSHFIDDEANGKIAHAVYLHTDESISNNFFYGFRQLTEIALKALSPGINDPGTAIESLRALFQLYAYRLQHYPDPIIKNDEGEPKLFTRELSFEEIFLNSLHPIWDYGKDDRMIRDELHDLLSQLDAHYSNKDVSKMLLDVQTAINDHK